MTKDELSIIVLQ